MPAFNFKCIPSLAPFMISNERLRFVRGPVGSSKSTTMVMELFRRACEQRPSQDGVRRTKFAVIRNTLQQIRETCGVTIDKCIGPLAHYKVSTQTIELRFSVGKTRVESDWLFLPLDTPEQIRKLLSLELTGAWVSEAREVDPEIVMSVHSRCGRYPSALGGGVPPSWYGVIAESNSFSEDSPWIFLEQEEHGWDYFVQPGAYEDGADWLEFLPPDYYADMMNNNTSNWIDQYVHNLIGPSLSGQAVFADAFDHRHHVAKQELRPIPERPLIIGLDVGRQPAATIGQRDARDRLLVLGSIWAENIGIEGFLRYHLQPMLAERFPYAAMYCVLDPASINKSQQGETSVLDDVRAAGFVAFPAATNAIAARLHAVESYLNRRDGMLFCPVNCADLISAMQYKYRFKRSKTDKMLSEIPEKSHPWSDLVDSTQYMCLGTHSSVLARRMSRGMTHPEALPVPPVAGWT